MATPKTPLKKTSPSRPKAKASPPRGPAHARARTKQAKASAGAKTTKPEASAAQKPEPAAEKDSLFEKRPVGRPSKYDPAFCDLLEEFMEEGYSIGAFAGLIGVDRSTITEWGDAHPEFSAAVSRAKCRRLMHWESIGLQVAKVGGGPGSATMVIFGLKNMGDDDWRDKQEIEHSGRITHEAALKELE